MSLLIQKLCLLSELTVVEFFSGYTPSDLMKISNIYTGLDLSNCSLEEVVEKKWVDSVSHKEYSGSTHFFSTTFSNEQFDNCKPA